MGAGYSRAFPGRVLLERRRPRERDVLARVAEGQSNRTIAAGMSLSEHTLERELGNIFAKLELPPGGEGRRRVLAVLTYLRAQED